MIGGHTICCNINRYSVQYQNLRSIVHKGAIVTAPISVSGLAVEHCMNKDNGVLEKIKNNLLKVWILYLSEDHILLVYYKIN